MFNRIKNESAMKKILNFFRALVVCSVPSLERRYHERKDAWRKHSERMQELLNRSREWREFYQADSRCNLINGMSPADLNRIIGKVPDYPDICR